MSQHHDGGQEERSWVSEGLAGDIGCGAVHGFEDRALVTDVTGGGETKPTDQTGAHVGENVSVQVRHDEDFVVVRRWVSDNLQAGVVEELGVEFDAGEVLGDSFGGAEEESIGHLHDGGFVDCADFGSSDILCILEGVSENTLTGFTSDKLDALNNTIYHNVLNSGVLPLSVLTDEDGIYVIVWGLIALDRAARSDVGKEVESSSEGQI